MTTTNDLHHAVVHLGFGVVIEPHLSFRLRSPYFPLGKIGGTPSWLNPINIPSGESLSCRLCSKQMAFLLQIYTGNPNNDHDFHRYIFIFICRNPSCSQINDASNIRVFRCQLPRINPYYSPDYPLDPDVDGDIPDPYANSSYPTLCKICGCFASKKCARCSSAWYCCRDHQVLDWSFSHKSACGFSKDNEKSVDDKKGCISGEFIIPKRGTALNPFVFPEYGIEMDEENVSRLENIKDSDDSGDDDDDDNMLAQRMKDYHEYINENELVNGLPNADFEGVEDSVVQDNAFKKFSKVVSLNPEQILRYNRKGTPLLATDNAPYHNLVPPCKICGASRCFELQLMPHLLSLLDVDSVGASIDWGTVMIYTCASNCRIEYDGYMEEWAIKQDFTSP